MTPLAFQRGAAAMAPGCDPWAKLLKVHTALFLKFKVTSVSSLSQTSDPEPG